MSGTADVGAISETRASDPRDPAVGGPVEIRNAAALCDHGLAALRASALRVAAAGLGAADVGRATEATISLTDRGVRVGAREYDLEPDSRVLVLGAGKASLAIAAALERALGDRISAGAVAVPAGEETSLERIEVLGADHPLPSDRSMAAAERLVELAGDAGEGDLALACFTGGSSALASLPPPDVTRDEKRRLHELLLAAGMPIAEINTVRKHVSAFKGGRLAAALAPARIVNLSASDVAGDALDTITDPTVPDRSTVAEAVAVLRDYGLWSEVPGSVRAHLEADVAASPSLDGVEIESILLATGAGVCDAMAGEAEAIGLRPVVLSTTLQGEAREIGRVVANLASESSRNGGPFAAPALLLACGGEATVTLGSAPPGLGGPNQEAALGAALELEGAQVVAVFLDTDGSDGSTAAAGAVADGLTVERSRDRDVNLRRALLAHRAGEALGELGDLVVTGPTGTNVNDLVVVAIAAADAGAQRGG